MTISMASRIAHSLRKKIQAHGVGSVQAIDVLPNRGGRKGPLLRGETRKAVKSAGSGLRFGLLTGALQDYLRLGPGQHAILEGDIPRRLKPWILLDRGLR